MGKILNPNETIEISKNLQSEGKHIVLTGGCFDILHTGHILFLEKAKEHGDLLFVLLENDENIKQTKGEKRPINNQTDRATVLAALSMIDYVILLPYMDSNTSYDELISSIKPAIIATTEGDPGRIHKERQAKLVDAQLVDVVHKLENRSTSRIAKILENEL